MNIIRLAPQAAIIRRRRRGVAKFLGIVAELAAEGVGLLHEVFAGHDLDNFVVIFLALHVLFQLTLDDDHRTDALVVFLPVAEPLVSALAEGGMDQVQRAADQVIVAPKSRQHMDQSYHFRRSSPSVGTQVRGTIRTDQIVGGIDQGEMRKSLRKVSQLSLGTGVVFLGQKADIVT